jgi:hypothetical protein
MRVQGISCLRPEHFDFADKKKSPMPSFYVDSFFCWRKGVIRDSSRKLNICLHSIKANFSETLQTHAVYKQNQA